MQHRDALAAAVDAVLARLDPQTDGDRPSTVDDSSALAALSTSFALSDFERDVLVLCAAMEIDPRTAALCAAAGGDGERPYPTFGLALSRLAAAHWSAITPPGPLRRFCLLEVIDNGALMTSRLRIDERVLHFLTGVPYPDPRLCGSISRCDVARDLPASQRSVADALASLLVGATAVNLTGSDTQTRREVGSLAANSTGLELFAIAADDVPTDPTERETLARLWEREAILLPAALLIEVDDPIKAGASESLVALLQVPVVLSSPDPLRAPLRHRPHIGLEPLPEAEQRELWRAALNGNGRLIAPGQLSQIVAQFSLPGHVIRTAGRAAAHDTDDVARAAWRTGLDHARIALDELGQRVEPKVTWDDLVLPDTQRTILAEIVAHVRHRATVYQEWGFDSVLRRGLGVTALFAGSSGTGKSLAAEVIAADLGLDLFVIDLSQIVSKYIGETEKNLRRVFDAAERGGAVLLFDEADALFGKRSEVKDSHDRYANLEVSYLLMRMEAYRGLAVLTTNQKKALDPAFMRRLRFVVEFPFPDVAERAKLWRRLIPAHAPVDGVETEKLARLTMPGGSIRNIALAAAFLAAEQGAPISMRHLLAAARTEYVKLERSLPQTEVAQWV